MYALDLEALDEERRRVHEATRHRAKRQEVKRLHEAVFRLKGMSLQRQREEVRARKDWETQWRLGRTPTPPPPRPDGPGDGLHADVSSGLFDPPPTPRRLFAEDGPALAAPAPSPSEPV